MHVHALPGNGEILCNGSLGLVQRSGQVYMVICVNLSRVGGSLPVNSTPLDPCSSYSASLASNTQMHSIVVKDV